MVQGEVQAPSREHVIADLRRIKYTITQIKERPAGLNFMALVDRLQTVSVYAVAVFTRQLATLLQAGVPLARALEALAGQSLDGKLTRALVEVNRDIKSGLPLSRALARHGHAFPPVYVSMVRAGEVSGAMDEILDRTANYLEREFRLRKRVSAAMVYPFLVLLASLGITMFLTNVVFPTFINLFRGININLPWTTRALITITEFLRNGTIVVPLILGLVGALVALRSYVRTPLGRRQWSWLQLELPLFGHIYHKIAMARFSRTLSTLLGSGIPLLHALKTTSYSLDNAVIADILEDVALNLKQGVSLAVPLEDYRQFPSLLVQMVSVGEEAGELPLVLGKLADLYDVEVEAELDSAITLIEPFMIFVMGLFVGFVLLAVFTPVYMLTQQF